METYRTMQEVITDHLRKMILSGEYGVGVRLQQDELAAKFRVSRMPIREALGILEAEGLVELRPHRGAVVTILTDDDIVELFDIRVALESRAAELAAPQLSGDDLERLRRCHEELGDLDPQAEQWVNLNHRFHSTIYHACGRPRLFTLIERHRNMLEPCLRASFPLIRRNPAKEQEEHGRILRAAEGRDPADLVRFSVEHLRAAERALLERRTRLAEPQLRPEQAAAS